MLDLAQEAKIDGVVCSPHELDLVVERKSLLSITPGIRLFESADDQSRVMTPRDAISKGADYIVIGRPITNAPNISEAGVDIVIDRVESDLPQRVGIQQGSWEYKKCKVFF